MSLSAHKLFSLDGILARVLRLASAGFFSIGSPETAVQCAALYGIIEVIGVKRFVSITRKKRGKKNGKGN